MGKFRRGDKTDFQNSNKYPLKNYCVLKIGIIKIKGEGGYTYGIACAESFFLISFVRKVGPIKKLKHCRLVILWVSLGIAQIFYTRSSNF
jgi:hypothetical protein